MTTTPKNERERVGQQMVEAMSYESVDFIKDLVGEENFSDLIDWHLQHLEAAKRLSYQQGRIAEAKICSDARNHDPLFPQPTITSADNGTAFLNLTPHIEATIDGEGK